MQNLYTPDPYRPLDKPHIRILKLSLKNIGNIKDGEKPMNEQNIKNDTHGNAGMALIPAGDFQMGNIALNDKEDEHSYHTVYIDSFFMDTYQVTNAAYKAFVDANPQWRKDRVYKDGIYKIYAEGYLVLWRDNNYPEGEGDHPVTFVSWHAAMAYAKWMGKRLPTEAEWEKAARGGLAGHKYPWGDTEPNGTQCNFADMRTDYEWSNMDVDDGYRWTAPVCSYPPNGYGLYDMAGNVWEWCLDAYHYKIDTNWRCNPIGGAARIVDVVAYYREIRTERVLRGGAWNDDARFLQVTSRDNYPPVNTEDSLGFRCVKNLSTL